MTIGVLTLVHGRRRLTRLLARYYATLRTSHTLAPVAVATYTDTWAREAMPGWQVLYYSNDYLSDKWTVGMQALRELDVDAALIIGSDDFCDVAFIEDCATMLSRFEYIMPVGLYFYDTLTHRALWREFVRCGAGRVLRKDLLDDCDWRPWQARSNVPDAAMNRIIEPRIGGVEKAGRSAGAVMDVKTDINMWPYDHLKKGAYRKVDADALLTEHFPSVAGELRQWNLYKEQLY